MDGVALAAVITSGVLGITTSSIGVWSARQNAKLARETRTQQRLADSYLAVLRIVEREGQWVAANITNWWLAAQEIEWDIPSDDRGGHLTEFERQQAPEPAATDQATVAAHLAAFGSDNVRKLYEAWRSTIEHIEFEASLLDESDLDLDRVTLLHEELHFSEVRARQALADAIAEELGHR